MDLDIIIFAVIWFLIIGYSVVKSKIQKENKKPEHNETKHNRDSQLKAIFEQLAAPKTNSAEPVKLKSTESDKLKRTEEKAKQPAAKPVVAKPATMTPVSYSIAEEGQRVTISKKKAKPTPAERTGLHNKENLKRAIIFGEVLQPKF